MKTRIALIITFMVAGILTFFTLQTAQSQCIPAATTGDDDITCDNVTGGDIEGGDGNDTIILNDSVNIPGNDVVGDFMFADGAGDDTIINYGIVDNIFGDSNTADGFGNDTLINNGTSTNGVAGDSGSGTVASGNDTIINNGDVAGNGLAGDSGLVDGSGNDIIINNGVAGGQGITGDSALGDGSGDDIIVNNGIVTTNGITGDSALGDGSGNDQITNNGTVNGFVTGDTGLGTGSGDDTITNNGTITNDVHGDSVLGAGTGNDTIINNGTIGGSIVAGGGNDTVVMGNNATVGGVIDGGDGFDSLEFAIQSLSEDELRDWAARLAAENPAGGSITLGGITYTWSNFEQLINALSQAPINGNTAPMQAFCRSSGDIDVYQIVNNAGVLAFSVSAGQIIAGLNQDTNTLIGSVGDYSLWVLSSDEIQLNTSGYEFRFTYEAFCGALPNVPPQAGNIPTDNEIPPFTIINRPLD